MQTSKVYMPVALLYSSLSAKCVGVRYGVFKIKSKSDTPDVINYALRRSFELEIPVLRAKPVDLSLKQAIHEGLMFRDFVLGGLDNITIIDIDTKRVFDPVWQVVGSIEHGKLDISAPFIVINWYGDLAFSSYKELFQYIVGNFNVSAGMKSVNQIEIRGYLLGKRINIDIV